MRITPENSKILIDDIKIPITLDVDGVSVMHNKDENKIYLIPGEILEFSNDDDLPLYRGIWDVDELYRLGDMVYFGNIMWMFEPKDVFKEIIGKEPSRQTEWSLKY